MTDLAEKKRMVRRLIGRSGRGFAEQSGFPPTNNPANLFQLLCLSVLLAGAGDDQAGAVRAARTLRERGGDTAGRLASRSPEQLRAALGADRRRGSRDPAGTLAALARAVVDTYRGDLRRLRAQARRDPARERQLMRRLPGVTDTVVDLFFREVQALWREVAPFADRRALAAARRLGLGRSTREVYEATGGRDAEKLSWLVGALVRLDPDRDSARLRALARP